MCKIFSHAYGSGFAFIDENAINDCMSSIPRGLTKIKPVAKFDGGTNKDFPPFNKNNIHVNFMQNTRYIMENLSQPIAEEILINYIYSDQL